MSIHNKFSREEIGRILWRYRSSEIIDKQLSEGLITEREIVEMDDDGDFFDISCFNEASFIESSDVTPEL